MPVCELNSSGQVNGASMFGANGLISRNTGNGTTYYAFDERGNVAQRTSSNGAVTSTDLYDAFGKQRSGASDVFGFGGQAGYYTDTETGLVLCTNRHYDPQSGRFLSRDPLGYEGGINLYSYTQNNPINGMDPDGTDATDNTIIAGLTVAGAWTGGAFGAGGGGIAGFGVGAIPGAVVGAGIGGAAGAASGVVAVGLRHAILNMMSGGGGGIETGPSEEDETPFYKGSDKHKPFKIGDIGAEPKDGQAALDNSVQIKATSPRRIGTDPANDEIVVLDKTHPDGMEYHGHVRLWSELEQKMKNALTESGRCNSRGKILK